MVVCRTTSERSSRTSECSLILDEGSEARSYALSRASNSKNVEGSEDICVYIGDDKMSLAELRRIKHQQRSGRAFIRAKSSFPRVTDRWRRKICSQF